MNNLETINIMLQDMPEKQLPEVLDFIQYLRRKNSESIFSDVAKRLEEWDIFVEAIHAADGEKVTNFERVNFDHEMTL